MCEMVVGRFRSEKWGGVGGTGGCITEFICMCQREPERGFVCELLKEGERGGVREGGKRDSQLGIPE